MKKPNKNTKGSALLLTLGILSLLLILAMSFAFSARTNKQNSRINADQLKVRLYSESGLGWVISCMNMTANTPANITIPYFFRKNPFDIIWWWNNDGDPFYNGETRLKSTAEQTLFISRQRRTATTDENNDLAAALNVGDHLPIVSRMLHDASKTSLLNLFPEHNDYEPNFRTLENDSDNGYLSRIAYLVLEDSNKIDVNQCLTLSTHSNNRPFVRGTSTSIGDELEWTGQPSNDDYIYNIAGYDADDNPIYPITESNTIRLGLCLQELRLDSRFFDNLPNATNIRIPWLSYYHLAEQSGLYSGANLYKYTFFSGDDIEAYWDGSQERQRFDITGTEWAPEAENAWEDADSQKINQQDYARNLIDALCRDEQRAAFYSNISDKTRNASPKVARSSFSADEGFGIPHLHTLGNTGHQIAANMIDFCDQDSFATIPALELNEDNGNTVLSYLLLNNGDQDLDYFGNDRVPYFNEITFTLEGKRDLTYSDPEDPDNENKKLFTYTLENPSIQLELLQIHRLKIGDRIPAGKSAVRIYFDELAYKKDDEAKKDFRDRLVELNILKKKSDDHPPYLEIPFKEYPKQEVTSLDESKRSVIFVMPELDIELPNVIGSVPNANKVEFSWKISKITMVSYDASSSAPLYNIYDFAWWQGNATGNVTPSSAIGVSMSASWEVTDPRINHKKGNWEYQAFAEGAANTIGKRNSNFPTATPSNCDTEEYSSLFGSGDEKKTFSTAFIPNRPFESLWEIGAIHRGSPFRTVQLLGDDRILADQLKVGPLKIHKGTYNINARNPIALAEFAKGIDIEAGDYETNSYASTPTFSDNGSDFTEVDWHAPSFNRSDSAPTFRHFNDKLSTKPTSDRAEEAFFARTVPLLTTRNERFTIVVASQLLKRVGDELSSTEWNLVKDTIVNPTTYTVKDPDGNLSTGYFSIQTTHRIIANVVMDAWRNEFKIVQMKYLED